MVPRNIYSVLKSCSFSPIHRDAFWHSLWSGRASGKWAKCERIIIIIIIIIIVILIIIISSTQHSPTQRRRQGVAVHHNNSVSKSLVGLVPSCMWRYDSDTVELLTNNSAKRQSKNDTTHVHRYYSIGRTCRTQPVVRRPATLRPPARSQLLIPLSGWMSIQVSQSSNWSLRGSYISGQLYITDMPCV